MRARKLLKIKWKVREPLLDFTKALESDAAAFSRKALPYGLILVPSDSFGLPGYFRIAFCTDTEKVVRSIDAFKAFVKAEY